MGFTRVRFNNFRNLESREIRWTPGLNLLTGVNGSGKTNILEAINILSGWGPLERGTKYLSLPTWNSGTTEVQLTGQLEGEEIIKVKISGRFLLKIDDSVISATDLRWKIPVLSFLPNDMAILEGSASCRRRLLDMILSLIVPPYALRLSDYRRGIRQKAAMLKQEKSTEIIDRVLTPLATWIWKMREEVVLLLSDCIKEQDFLLPEKGVFLCLKRGGSVQSENIEEDYNLSLIRNREKERVIKMPIVGPHRDDIIIKTDGKLAACALSRGFRRRVAIALILAATDGVKRKMGRAPVLLLDEVTAELDLEGKELLFRSLLERKTQVFAATAEPGAEDFPGERYTVSDGRVMKNE